MQNHPKLYIIILVGIATFFGIAVCWVWFDTVLIEEEMQFMSSVHTLPTNQLAVQLLRLKNQKQKPVKIEVKGLYLTAYSAGNSKTVDGILDLIDETELNAIVIDVKDYSGKVLYDSNVLLVGELGLENNRIGDTEALIKKLHEHKVYVIARQTVFQDPILAEKKPEWAMQSKVGGLWRDRKGLAWVDPTKQEVWEYNVEIAKEVIGFGFDEVQFDYVRFPSDGDMSQVVYTNGGQERYEVMRDFYHYLGEQLTAQPAWISLDMFGFVMERYDGMSIGQRLEDAVDAVDYISPMMYPSHYPVGHLGLKNPAASPGIVIENGMKKGIPYFENQRAMVRPWIQAFNIGAVYDATKIRVQIDIVEKYTDGGWMLWNASNRYSSAGLER